MKVHYVVAVNNNDIFRSYLLASLEALHADVAIVSDNTNENPKPSIFKKYNCGIEKTLETLGDDDIITFVHEDVRIIDPNFEAKVKLLFSKKDDVGVLGVAGTILLPESGAWWQNPPDHLRGHLMQGNNGDACAHLIKGMTGFYDDLVAVDGMCLIIKGSLFKQHGLRFDERSYKGFHFYDISMCLAILELGYRVACADILLEHRSAGDVTNDAGWHAARDVFIASCKAKNYTFPLASGKILCDQVSNVTTIEV